ncbi:translation initiation factor IF3-2, chloroplastic [Eurytemora carolleeae]|uniref:translation initiation factor IF3-2, chloroplastic n=1 Tax=Eurytemora carolleeae TaxID=1294199 RepID=UPI000C77BA4E|nr:translation initiation factor IF3-2, chloroplastic [Eurytemora carolleeae]|eukprot:XP_023340802.1 translation initiation factor IF3-2, chloroplastic-like [Eurytemora affinis]
MELGRNLGRRKGGGGDSLEASRRRLEIYRELTLPLLKTFDEEGRLRVVDGDSDSNQVLSDLNRVLSTEMSSLLLESVLKQDTGKYQILAKGQKIQKKENKDLGKTEDLIDELEREIDQENEALEKEIAETYEEVEVTLESPTRGEDEPEPGPEPEPEPELEPEPEPVSDPSNEAETEPKMNGNTNIIPDE